MPIHRQQPVWPQHLCSFAGAPHGVDPMPGLAGDDRVERTAACVPIFEFADLDLDPGPPGDLGHPRVGVNAEHRAAGRPILPCSDSGTAADIQKFDAGARGDDTLYQDVGVARPRPVVSFGVYSEGFRYLPKPVRLPLGKWRGLSRRFKRRQGASPFYALTARQRSLRPLVSTSTSSKPAARNRSGNVSGDTGLQVSRKCKIENRVDAALSLPAKVPPGRSSRNASANNWSCSAGVGTWCSIVKHTTELNSSHARPVFVPSPWMIRARSPYLLFSRSAIGWSISTAV